MWRPPRIHGELLKLEIDVSESTVARYMTRSRRPPSQTWKTFLRIHMRETVSIDFFTVPTATFRNLHVLVVLSHDQRRIVHFNVTDSPTALWTGRQPTQAFPWNTAPKYLVRDNDGIYGIEFQRAVKNLGTALTNLGKYEEARNAFGRALARKPEFAPTYRMLGRVAMETSSLEETKLHFEHASQLDPRSGIEGTITYMRRGKSRERMPRSQS